jgi:hypothetical protein
MGKSQSRAHHSFSSKAGLFLINGPKQGPYQNTWQSKRRGAGGGHEIKADGTYPGLSSESDLWLTDENTTATEAKVISIYKEAGTCPLPWFNKGPLPAGLVNSAASVLQVDYEDAHKFCKNVVQKRVR